MNRWHTCVSISGETGLGQKLEQAGVKRANGLSARVAAINVDSNPDLTDDWAKVEAGIANFGFAGPAYIQALAEQGHVADREGLKDAIKERQDDLVTEVTDDTTPAKAKRLLRRNSRIWALMWTAAEIMQKAGLIPAEFDAKAMTLRLWLDQRDSDVAPRDPVERAIDTLRANIASRRGLTISDGSPLSDVNVLYREPDGYPEKLSKTQLEQVNAARAEAGRDVIEPAAASVYIIRASKLAGLAGDTLPDRTLRRALVEQDIAIPFAGSTKGEIAWWGGFVGRGRESFIVLRRDQIDYEEPAKAPAQAAA